MNTKGKTMDGMITPAGVVVLGQGPQPFTTSDAMARDAVETAHARAMAAQAQDIANIAAPDPGFALGRDATSFSSRLLRAPASPRMEFDPTAAARAAEEHHREAARIRCFEADRIRGLWLAGRLSAPQYRASDEIHDLIVWQESGRQVLASASYSERMSATTGGVPLNQRLEEAERERFLPWSAWAAGFQVKADGKTLEHLVRAACVQRLGVEQLANTFRMHRRRAEALLVRALHRYAVIARWEAQQEVA
ncbi:hypothetical protein KPL78_19195 [Roseomonas sp. HJA6]|uniref:Uncharacterized protein n=1 Tax=Roseomonas alba TaxID=2846776 RepID=A0ABS7AFC6_9PROT|nr:hypothetical protein [Neoroseomonas alba]MBW6399995.1 hypothetical protein [Neoroseomonas alba]